MTAPLYALGMFVFASDTLAPADLQRSAAWRHSSANRIGARPASQFTGPGEETVTLSGQLVPEIAGAYSDIDRLREMAATGDQHALTGGDGEVFGTFVIVSADDNRTVLIEGGKGRSVDFTLSLKRVGP